MTQVVTGKKYSIMGHLKGHGKRKLFTAEEPVYQDGVLIGWRMRSLRTGGGHFFRLNQIGRRQP